MERGPLAGPAGAPSVAPGSRQRLDAWPRPAQGPGQDGRHTETRSGSERQGKEGRHLRRPASLMTNESEQVPRPAAPARGGGGTTARAGLGKEAGSPNVAGGGSTGSLDL